MVEGNALTLRAAARLKRYALAKRGEDLPPDLLDKFTTPRPTRAHIAPQEQPSVITLHPRKFQDIRAIGDAYREGNAVIVNLSDMSDPEAMRTIDFCAGLIYHAHGSIDRVTSKVFLLSPDMTQKSTQSAASAGESSGQDDEETLAEILRFRADFKSA